MKRFLVYIILAVLIPAGAEIAAQQAEEPVSKTYRIQYKTAEEFRPLVQAMLPNRGQVTMSADMNLLVVFDRPAYLAQIDSLFHNFDLPAQQFLVSIQLLLGSNDPEAIQSADSTELHEQLDQYYAFEKLEELDKVFVRAEEKAITTFDLAGGQFNIYMELDHIQFSDVPVRFRSFVLNEYVRDISGKFRKIVYSTSAEMREDMREILAAVKLESTGKTLILLVTVSVL